jgi:UDP-2,4-diacetamido-2,4,6-trideoxy-beta-L-altropyranose hydrolase
MPNQLALRVDGGSQIGTGHVMRCLTLADYWKEGGGTALFVMAQSTPALDERIGARGWNKVQIVASAGSREDALETTQQIKAAGIDLIVADGYSFGTEWQETIIASGSKLLLFDDFGHAKRYVAHLVLNQNLHAREDLYKDRAAWTRLLLGNRYLLLGRQFLSWTPWRRAHPLIGKKVLVTFGGSDPQNITSFVIRAFKQVEEADYELRIVVGGSNANALEVERLAAACRQSCQVLHDVKDMATHMAWADWAVMGGGTTCWEAAFMQLPAIAISCAPQEDLLLDSLSSHGLLRKLGHIKDCTLPALTVALSSMARDKTTRESMGKQGRKLVDGLGASRVIDALHGLTQC